MSPPVPRQGAPAALELLDDRPPTLAEVEAVVRAGRPCWCAVADGLVVLGLDVLDGIEGCAGCPEAGGRDA